MPGPPALFNWRFAQKALSFPSPSTWVLSSPAEPPSCLPCSSHSWRTYGSRRQQFCPWLLGWGVHRHEHRVIHVRPRLTHAELRRLACQAVGCPLQSARAHTQGLPHGMLSPSIFDITQVKARSPKRSPGTVPLAKTMCFSGPWVVKQEPLWVLDTLAARCE